VSIPAGLAVVNYVSAEDEEKLGRLLGDAGFRRLDLDGAQATDTATIFRQASEQLFGGAPTNEWHALGQHVEDLIGDGDEPVALVWRGADRMLDGGLGDLVDALDTLTGVSRNRYTDGRVFVTILLGEGPNFPPLRLGA
jgi:hypothetical protein